MLEHVALVVLAIANIILVLSAYFAQKEVLTKADLAQVWRDIVRGYAERAAVNAQMEVRVNGMLHQQDDHNVALAAIVAYLEKQGFKVKPGLQNSHHGG